MKVTLTVAHGPHAGKSFTFQQHDNFIVGRASYAHFRLPRKDRYFSRVHFMIEINPPYCRLMDMGSRNGTFVNNQRVQTVDIHDGDVIKGGKTVIKVAIAGADESVGMVPEVSRDSLAGGPPDEAAEPISGERPDRQPDSVRGESQSAPDIRNVRGAAEVPHISPDERLPEWVLELLPDDYLAQINGRAQPVPDHLLVDEIGRGRTGVVYRALCRRVPSVAAVRVVEPAVCADTAEVDRFLREVEALTRLDHPHIVGLREVGRARDLLYFAMEYVPGVNAEELLEETGGPLDIPRAVGITCQMLLALEYAHGRGVVHRDIKPENILLTQQQGRGIVKVADFGLLYAYQASRLSGLTMMNERAGVSPYLAPEQMTDYRQANPATDQYATAAALYHLLTDRDIYDYPDSINATFTMILQDEPVPIQSRRPEIPDELAGIIHRALSRSPEDRFADVSGMRAALVDFLDSQSAADIRNVRGNAADAGGGES